MLTLGTAAASDAARDCAASDRALLVRRKILCSSMAQTDTPWCGSYWSNVTAKRDWPNQAVYMLDLIRALYANTTCLSTPYANAPPAMRGFCSVSRGLGQADPIGSCLKRYEIRDEKLGVFSN